MLPTPLVLGCPSCVPPATMSSSSAYWNRGWNTGWTGRSWWQQDEESPATTGRSWWQQGEESPATKWARGKDGQKWQGGSCGDVDAESTNAPEKSDSDAYDVEMACHSKRMRPPKRVREYQREVTRRLVHEVLSEVTDVGEAKAAEVCKTPPRAPRSLPKPPPMPPTWAQKQKAEELAQKREAEEPAAKGEKEDQEPAAKAEKEDQRDEVECEAPKTPDGKTTPKPKRRPQPSGLKEEKKKDSESEVESPEKKDSPKAAVEKGSSDEEGLPYLTILEKGIQRILNEGKELRDELDSGMFLGATPAFMTKMLEDWQTLGSKLQEAERMSADVIKEIKAWSDSKKKDE